MKSSTISAKSASLLAGVLQQASLVLIIRFSKTQHEDNDIVYLTSVAVAASELFKLGLSYVVEVKSHHNEEMTSSKTIRDKVDIWKKILKRMLNVMNLESAKLIIPALLYLVQNNLLFVALSNLSVPLYQVTNQGKLLTTALISRVLLKKEISGLQYFSIALLGLGVAVIHLSEYYAKHSSESIHAQDDAALRHQNQVLGLCAVLVSCFTSGFSGVYFELILKTSKTKQSLHVKNFQLALWSFVLSACLIFSKDSKKIRENGLFQGFDWIVILVIVAQGMTGFIVSLMLNYADAVLKGFAIAVAAIFSTVLSVAFFGTRVDASFLVGASLVLISVKLYSYNGNKRPMLPSSAPPMNAEGKKSWKKYWLRLMIIALPLALFYHNIRSLKKMHTEYYEKTKDQEENGAMSNDILDTMLRHQFTEKQNTVTRNKTQHISVVNDKSSNAMDDICELRDLSDFSTEKIGNRYNASFVSNDMIESNCLFYNCTTDLNQCNNALPTNFDGHSPPCCTHILRDMARIFDDTMCSLGLDYSAGFGTLLGLRREDRLVPWTIDNDYIIPSKDAANAMVSLWDSKKTGMAHIFQGINRMCVTPDFAGGELAKKWSLDKPPRHQKALDFAGFVYIDFYLGYNATSELFGTIDHCRHLYSDVFPTKRELVYNGTFAQRFPANSEQLLRTFYGKNWRMPRADKNPHGGKLCPYDPTYS